MKHFYLDNIANYKYICLLLCATAMWVMSGCVEKPPVVPTNSSIPLSITPNVTELVNGQTVIISVVSDIWSTTDLKWQVTSDELKVPGELSSNVEPSIVYSAPQSGHGAVKISVIGHTNEVTGTADIIFDIRPAGTYANHASNLRSGPGANYNVVGAVKQFQQLNIIANNPAGDWYKLDTNAWIAAFLVNNAPKDLPVVETTDSASNNETPVARNNVGALCNDGFLSSVINSSACSNHLGIDTWIESNDNYGQVQQEGGGSFPFWRDYRFQNCNGVEWKVTDVRRGKSVYWERSGFEATGQWIVVYIHTKNSSSQTISPSDLEPRLNGYMFHMEGTSGAAYMATGGYNHPLMKINPNQEIGFVVAWDVHAGLGTMNLEMKTCNQALNLGDVWGTQQGIIKASN